MWQRRDDSTQNNQPWIPSRTQAMHSADQMGYNGRSPPCVRNLRPTFSARTRFHGRSRIRSTMGGFRRRIVHLLSSPFYIQILQGGGCYLPVGLDGRNTWETIGGSKMMDKCRPRRAVSQKGMQRVHHPKCDSLGHTARTTKRCSILFHTSTRAVSYLR